MAFLPRRSEQRRSLTASAARLRRGDGSAYATRVSQHWQNRALEYYDLIGELRYGSQFIAKQLSRVRFYPGRLDKNGKVEEISSGLPVDILDQVQDPGGGRSQLQYRYGLLQAITGEGVLFSYEEGTRWKFLWNDEVKELDSGLWVRLDSNKKPTSDVGIGYRLWTPHPKHSDEPDAPVRAILDICEELLILTASVRSTAVSRMTNGVQIIPLEGIPQEFTQERSGSDEDPESNLWLSDYIEHTTNQIENPGSAAASVPFLYTPPYEYADRVRWMATHDPQTDYLERELRVEAIKRMALGMDMPPEALLGMTDANHWTAKQVMHDMWRSHGMPKAEQFADELSEAYLKPSLEEEGFPGADRILVGVDDSMVVISPDRTQNANEALDRVAIGFSGYRQLMGIPEDMAPSDEEKEFLLFLKTRQPIDVEGDGIVMPERGPLPQNGNGSGPEEGPPEPTRGREGSRQEARTASARILGAAELALLRCRELAGVRIRHKCKDCAEGHPDALVAAILGPAESPEPMKLVRGGTDGFHHFLMEKDFEQSQATALCQMLELWAAKTLFDPRHPQLPSGFTASVEKAQEVSNALVEQPV